MRWRGVGVRRRGRLCFPGLGWRIDGFGVDLDWRLYFLVIDVLSPSGWGLLC